MIDVDKKYWVYISPSVYCSLNKKQAFLYNTLSGEKIETKNFKVLDILYSMHEKKNLGAICCEGNDLIQNGVMEFIIEFCEKKMGNIADIEQMPKKPIQLMPILNLQCDIEKHRNIGSEILRNLRELNIYLNSSCKQSCHYCNEYYRQIHSCTIIDRNKSLDISVLKNILSQIYFVLVGKINILGGNILQYPELLELSKILADFNNRIHFYIHYKNYKRSSVLENFQTELIVNFPVSNKVFEKVWAEINKDKTNVNFIIENEEQYIIAEQLIENHNIEKTKIKPFFNGKNIDFFKENIFMSKEDVFSKTLSMRDIFCNQKLNSNFFGILHIFQDGMIKTNPNMAIIGNIKQDKILDLVYKEMLENTAWRKQEIHNLAANVFINIFVRLRAIMN